MNCSDSNAKILKIVSHIYIFFNKHLSKKKIDEIL